jgi:hypothetical protein
VVSWKLTATGVRRSAEEPDRIQTERSSKTIDRTQRGVHGSFLELLYVPRIEPRLFRQPLLRELLPLTLPPQVLAKALL